MKRVISAFLCMVMILGLASCKGETNKPEKEKEQYFCKMSEGKIKVLSLESADGIFVEKGRKDEVKGVATIVVRNDSEQMLEYGTIVFRVNDIERAEFIVSALPAGEQCVVMETTARPLNQGDNYTANHGDSVFAYCDQSIESDKYTVKVEGSTFKVTNNTDSPLNVRIAYKYYMDKMYYGGIAFNSAHAFENIAPHQTVEKESSRFDSDCRIVNITTDTGMPVTTK